MTDNTFENCIEVSINVFIRNAIHFPAAFVQIGISSAVVGDFRVRPMCLPIDLYDQTMHYASKVGDVRADWVLSTEPIRAELVIS